MKTTSDTLCACGCGKLTPIAPETRPKRGWVKGEPMKFIPHHSKHRWPVSDGVTKQCRRCNQFLPVGSFWRNSSNADRLQHACKECSKTAVYSYRSTEQGRISYARSRVAGRLKTYRITHQDYAAMEARQDYRCAICRQPEKTGRGGTIRRLCIDHCHTTGRVRGLLCSDCNQGIGKLGDDASRILRAYEYLSA